MGAGCPCFVTAEGLELIHAPVAQMLRWAPLPLQAVNAGALQAWGGCVDRPALQRVVAHFGAQNASHPHDETGALVW